jgi:glycolate oxidase iron-sulfur subunit
MADKVLRRKVENVKSTGAQVLVTSNPGCLIQLKKALAEEEPPVKVMHLTEILHRSLAD